MNSHQYGLFSRASILVIPKQVLSVMTSFMLVFATLLTTLPTTASAIPVSNAVYDALPNPLPPNVPSEGFQANQTFELGDLIQLGGSDRILDTVTVTMSNWALEATPANVAFCAIPSNCTPGGFIHPITINVYATGSNPSLPGVLLATKTVDITVPWRPAEDSTNCPTKDAPGYAYKYQAVPGALDTNCYNGYTFNAVFDMSDLAVTLPDNVIVTVAYNTQTYGASPTGVDGPYNSLNVGLPPSQPVTVGSDGNIAEVFVKKGSGPLQKEAGWAPYGTVAMSITASAPTHSSESIVVTPMNMQNWAFSPENTTGGQSGQMIAGPVGVPLGVGSAQFVLTASNESEILATSAYAGTPLRNIHELSYQTYRVSGDPAPVPSLSFEFDNDVTDADSGWRSRMVYEPYHTQTVNTGVWQEWDTRDDAAGTATGNWWGSPNGLSTLDDVCPQSNPCTWSEVLSNFPNAGIRNAGPLTGLLLFKAGSGWASFDGNVDKFVIGVQSGANIHTTTYDFEPQPGSIEVIKYVCPAGTTVTRAANGVGLTVPVGCEFYEGATFGFVHGTATDANPPHTDVLPVSNHTVTEGATDSNGALVFANLAPTGRYLVFETDGAGNQLSSSELLGLYCIGDGDTSGTNDNQELTFVAPGGTARCVAYNEADTTPPSTPVLLTPSDGSTTPTNEFDFTWQESTDDEPGNITYEFHSSMNSASTTGVLTTNLWTSGTLPDPMIHSSGAPDGTWYWQVRARDVAGNWSDWSEIWSVTLDTSVPPVDTTGPTAPSIIFPAVGQVFSSSPILNDWTEATDPSGIAKYEIEYVYSDGHTFTGGPYRETMASVTERNHAPSIGEQGGVTIRVRAYDLLGNIGAWSNSVYYIYDTDGTHSSRIIQPVVDGVVMGVTDLTAYYADQNGDGNDGVQWAVRSGTSCSTGNLFGNVGGLNSPFSWDGTNFSASIDTTTIPNGTYCFIFNPSEDSGNTNQRLTRTFTVDNPLPDPTSTVHIYKYLDDGETETLIPNDTLISYLFPMRASWSATNIGSGSGSYVLGNDHGHPAEGLNYTASTSVMSVPASYATHEVTNDEDSNSIVLPPSASCQPNMYKLLGYRSGATLSEAEDAPLSLTAPSFTGLDADKHIIVVNKKCGDEPEITYADSVKVCKVNQFGDELPGWTVYLKGAPVQTISTLYSNSSLGANSIVLDDYTSYLVTASGTWTNQGGANLVDADFSTLDSWATQMNGYTGYGEDILDLQIDQSFVDWGSYSSNHEYLYGLTPTTDASVNFRVFDGEGGVQNEAWFADNEGSLSIDISKGFIGETGEDGCVTFTDVPHDSYTIGEIAQDGWENVNEGVGVTPAGETVIVDDETELFTLMNDNGEEAPAYGSITIVKEITSGDDDIFTFESDGLGGVDGEFSIETIDGTGTTTFRDVVAGTYSVNELVPDGWDLESATCSDESSVNAIHLAAGEDITCTFTNAPETEAPPQETLRTLSGNGPISGSIAGSSQGQVLGVAIGPDDCSETLLSSYMRRGMNNKTEDVRTLQTFLNGEMGTTLPLTGFFGVGTENAVKSFQLKYAADILTPWDLTEPTGYVYKTTLRKINLLHCSALDIPMPDLR